jgi:hypothetical protein
MQPRRPFAAWLCTTEQTRSQKVAMLNSRGPWRRNGVGVMPLLNQTRF